MCAVGTGNGSEAEASSHIARIWTWAGAFSQALPQRSENGEQVSTEKEKEKEKETETETEKVGAPKNDVAPLAASPTESRRDQQSRAKWELPSLHAPPIVLWRQHIFNFRNSIIHHANEKACLLPGLRTVLIVVRIVCRRSPDELARPRLFV